MHEGVIQAVIGAMLLVPVLLGYWVLRYVQRRNQRALLQAPRVWQPATLQRWAERGWLELETASALPAELSPAVLFYEWAAVDPDIAASWRFREPVRVETPLEALARDAWNSLPAAERERSLERLREGVRRASSWWGGAEHGWNGRPFTVLDSSVTRKQSGLPLLALDDLSAAPLASPLCIDVAAADGPELVLALAALRRQQGRFMHPLAPRNDGSGSLLRGLSTQVATDVGRRVGGGLGAVLGPIGSMVGQYLGEMAGRHGARMLADQAVPEPLAAALKETEAALVRLGELARSDDFARAAAQPGERILELGKRLEFARAVRSRGLRERVWPSTGLVLLEETLRVALGQMESFRAAGEFFVKSARASPEAVAGGMILQNPWLVRLVPGAVERLNGARAALNQAALSIRGLR